MKIFGAIKKIGFFLASLLVLKDVFEGMLLFLAQSLINSYIKFL
jgi:hypothetical protein